MSFVTLREKITFANLSGFQKFVGQETKFWKEQGKRVDATGQTDRPVYFECAVKLEAIAESINSLRDQLSGLNKEQLEQEVQGIQQNFDHRLRKLWLWSNHSYIQPFVECHIEYGSEVATAFINPRFASYSSKSQ